MNININTIPKVYKVRTSQMYMYVTSVSLLSLSGNLISNEQHDVDFVTFILLLLLLFKSNYFTSLHFRK